MPATGATQRARVKCVHGHKGTLRFLQWKETFLELINVCLSTARPASHSDPDTDSPVRVKPAFGRLGPTSSAGLYLPPHVLPLPRSGFLCLRDNFSAFENMH